MKWPRIKYLLILISVFILPFNVQCEPVKIIFDTDMESDVDDVGALAMLHGLSEQDQCEILATISSSLNPWAAPTIDVINTFFGHPDIPIGNVKTFGVYRNSKYSRSIVDKYPQDIGLGENAPDAVDIYRKILSEQPDSSIIIVSVGYVTNLYNLLKSGPDDYSPLPGPALVQKKVKHYVCMGGRYPLQQDPGKWGNFKPDPRAIQYVAQFWPTDIIFTAGGDFADAIPTGKILFEHKRSTQNPVSNADEIFLEGWNRNYHHSADLIAVYVAVKGVQPYFQLKSTGYNHIFTNGTNVWRRAPDKPNHFIVAEFAEGIDPIDLAYDSDSLMIK